MSIKKDKKTRFVSSKTVVTDEYLNSMYGGLKDTEMESFYSTTDPLVAGHIHDGGNADGHAQKINLEEHTVGSIDLTSQVKGQLPASKVVGGGSGLQNIFKQVVADTVIIEAQSTTDLFNINSGSGISTSVNQTTNTITISATGGAGSTQNLFHKVITDTVEIIASSSLDFLNINTELGLRSSVDPATNTINLYANIEAGSGITTGVNTTTNAIIISSPLVAEQQELFYKVVTDSVEITAGSTLDVLNIKTQTGLRSSVDVGTNTINLYANLEEGFGIATSINTTTDAIIIKSSVDYSSLGFVSGTGAAYRVAYFNTTDTITATVDFDLNFGTNNFLNIPMDLRIDNGEKLFLFSNKSDVLNGVAGNSSYLYSGAGSVYVGINGQDKYELNATVFRPLINKTISLGGSSNAFSNLYLGSVANGDISILSGAATPSVKAPDSKGLIKTTQNLEINIAAGLTNNLNLVANNGSATLNLNFYDNDSTHYVGLTSPAVINTSHTLVLPVRDGDPNHVLITDGSGNLSFAPTPMRTIDFIAPIDPSTVFTTTQVRAQIFDDGTTDSSFEIVVRNYDISTVDDQQRKIIVTKEGHIIPSTFEMQDIGTTTDRFRDLYLSGSTIWLGERALSFDETSGRIKSLRVKEIHNNPRAHVGKIEETEYSQFEAHNFVIQFEHGEKGDSSDPYETTINGDASNQVPFQVNFGKYNNPNSQETLADIKYLKPTESWVRSSGFKYINDSNDADPTGIGLSQDFIDTKGYIRVNNNYILPIDEGQDGQALVYRPGGQVVWGNPIPSTADLNIQTDRLVSGSHEFILRPDGHLVANKEDFQDFGLDHTRFRDIFLNENAHLREMRYIHEGTVVAKPKMTEQLIELKFGSDVQAKPSYILEPKQESPYAFFSYVDDGSLDPDNKGLYNLSVTNTVGNYVYDNVDSKYVQFSSEISDHFVFNSVDSRIHWDTREGAFYEGARYVFMMSLQTPKHFNIDNFVDTSLPEINNFSSILTHYSNNETLPEPTYFTFGIVKRYNGNDIPKFQFAIGHKTYDANAGIINPVYDSTGQQFGIFDYEINRNKEIMDVILIINDDTREASLYINGALESTLTYNVHPSLGSSATVFVGSSPLADAPKDLKIFNFVTYMSEFDPSDQQIINFSASIDSVQVGPSLIRFDNSLIDIYTRDGEIQLRVGETKPISVKENTVEFFEAYRIPTVDGSTNQVIKTNGLGDLYWDYAYDLAVLIPEILATIDIPIGLLSDVSFSNLQDGDYLTYNSATGEWVNSTLDVPRNVEDLRNVSVSNLESNDVLAYVNSTVGWVNKGLEELYGIPQVLNDLNDVSLSSVASGEFLVSDGNGNWSNQSVEIPLNIEELHNVTTTNPQTQDVITWSGTEWVNLDVETILSIPKDLSDLNVKLINDLDDVITTGVSHGQLLQYRGRQGTFDYWQPTPSALPDYAGQFLVWKGNRGNNLAGYWETQPQGYTNDGITSIPNNSLLKWSSSGNTWVYTTIDIPRNIEDLENVSTSTVSTHDVIIWDGTEWTNITKEEYYGILVGVPIPEDLVDLGTKILDNLDDVSTAGALDNHVLLYNSATGIWEPGFQPPGYEFVSGSKSMTVDTVINLGSDANLYSDVNNTTNTIIYGLNNTIDITSIKLNGVYGSAGYVMAVDASGELNWSRTGLGDSNFDTFISNGLTLTVDTFVSYNYDSNFNVSVDSAASQISLTFKDTVDFNVVRLNDLYVNGTTGNDYDVITRLPSGGIAWASIDSVLSSAGLIYTAGDNIVISTSNVVSTNRNVDFDRVDVTLLNINQLQLKGVSGNEGQLMYVGSNDVLQWAPFTIGNLNFVSGKNIEVYTTTDFTSVRTLDTVDFTEVNLADLKVNGVRGTLDQYITVNGTGDLVWSNFPTVGKENLQELLDVDLKDINGALDVKENQVIKYDYSNSIWKPEYIQDSYYIDSVNHNSSSMLLPPTNNYTSYLIDSHALITNYGGSHVEVLLQKSDDWYSGTEISIKNVSRGGSNHLKISWNSSSSSDFVEYKSGSNSHGVDLYPDASVILIIRKGFSGYEAYIKASHGTIDSYQNINVINVDTVSSNNSSQTKLLVNDNYTNLPEEVPVQVDLTAPVITLNSIDPFYIELGYDTPANTPDPGVIVIDDVDNPISAVSDWNSVVKYNTIDTYNVTYTATDSSGKTTDKTRTVVVRDTTPPNLVLNTVQLFVNQDYPNGNYMDKIQSTFDYSSPVTVVMDTSEVQIDQGTYRVVYIATDAQGNVSTADATVIVNDYDADGDGILNSRDHFPYDPSEKSDIDGDGVGDSDTIILHQDFKDTLEYLEIDETKLSSAGPTTAGTEGVDYNFEDATINGLTKRVVSMGSGVSIAYNGNSVNLSNTSINFSMSIPSNYDIPTDSSGGFIYLNALSSTPYGRFAIYLKKVRNNITNEETFRFSIYLRPRGSWSAPHFADKNSVDGDIFVRDLSDYTILNFGASAGSEFPGSLPQGASGYNSNPSAYLINNHHISNFDIPNDDQFHAFSFKFGSLVSGSNSNQIGIYMDGNLKCIYEHTNSSPFNFTSGDHTLKGNSSLGNIKFSDYIWTTDFEDSKLVEIQEKMLNTTFAGPLVSLSSDLDGDGIDNLTEQTGGEYDYTLANTDQNTDPNNEDQLDDFIENYIVAYLNGSSNIVSGWNITAGSSTFDDTQTEFKNYYTGELTTNPNITLSKTSTISFWFYNTGSLSGSARLFKNTGAGAWDPIGIDSNGLLYIRQSMQTSTVRLGSQNLWDHASSNGIGEWCNIIITTNEDTSETKIYFNKVLFDTINYGFTNNTNFNRIMNGTVFHANGWTHFAYWNRELNQSKVNQIYDRGFMAQYDILNSYPPVITFAPDITIDSHFFYHETLFNFDQYINAVTISSGENCTVTIDNIDSMPFGVVGTSDVIYKATGDSSGLTAYLTKTLTIEAFSGTQANTYNSIGIFEELPNGGNVSTTFTPSAYNQRTLVMPDGANTVTISGIQGLSDYGNGFTISYWQRPHNYNWYGNNATLLRFINASNTVTMNLRGGDNGRLELIKHPNGGLGDYATSGLGFLAGNNDRWSNITLTWEPGVGLKFYGATESDNNLGVLNYLGNVASFGRYANNPLEDFDKIVFGGTHNSQRAFDGMQIANRVMTEEEIYSYLRRYLVDQTTLLG